MSKIIWSNQLLPTQDLTPTELFDESYQEKVFPVLKITLQNTEFKIPDPKAFRSMTRASLFLSHICHGIEKDILLPYLNRSPFQIGIYCAIENGPIDAPTTLKMVNTPFEQFAETYRKLRNPKMYLKQLPNLAPAQMGIFLNIQGPMNVYTHSQYACLHALQQAELDLSCGQVQAALVCTAHAFDDYLVVKRAKQLDSRLLSEGAAALLLISNHEFTTWSLQRNSNKEIYFGISDLLISITNHLQSFKEEKHD